MPGYQLKWEIRMGARGFGRGEGEIRSSLRIVSKVLGKRSIC